MESSLKKKRLVVFDLDLTLITPAPKRYDDVPGSCFPLILSGMESYVIYVRPHMETALIKLWEDPNNTLVLFSGGSPEYVRRVLDDIIYPLTRGICPGFTFDAVYSSADLGPKGEKLIGPISDLFHTETSLIIDDKWWYCMTSGSDCYHLIEPFTPTKADSDFALLRILDLDFFAR